uniref:Uncharacterized protein n=1 Tax=Setaria italica TaxID=4555 RepID=K4ANC4_SETIT
MDQLVPCFIMLDVAAPEHCVFSERSSVSIDRKVPHAH